MHKINNILSVEKLSVAYNNNEILTDINANIEKNKITAIIGASGCGKSTFLKSLNRINEYDGAKVSGIIKYNDASIYDMDIEQLRTSIGMVFQSPSVFSTSIYNNISFALRYHQNSSKTEVKNIVKEVLMKTELYDEVNKKLKMSATRLSGGQQQRLCIARSLAVNPDILLLDEPCSSLDVKNTMFIERLLLELKKEITVVIVTHNLSQAKRIADKIIYMKNGKIEMCGNANEVFNYLKINTFDSNVDLINSIDF